MQDDSIPQANESADRERLAAAEPGWTLYRPSGHGRPHARRNTAGRLDSSPVVVSADTWTALATEITRAETDVLADLHRTIAARQ